MIYIENKGYSTLLCLHNQPTLHTDHILQGHGQSVEQLVCCKPVDVLAPQNGLFFRFVK
jgi:hypothetical protein